MNNNQSLSRINQILERVSSIAICLPEKPTLDGVAAALSLYQALVKSGKDVTIASSSPISQDYNLIGTEKILSRLGVGGDTLVVSFPYTEGSIDKVSYNIEGDKFNLLIQPRQGFDKLNPQDVQFLYTGGQTGAIFTIDAPSYDSLGALYTSDQDQFKGKDIINIDRHLTNANFGSVNIVEKQSSSMSEVMTSIIKALNIEIDRDMATNLYTGIVSATNNFTAFSVNAQTFEACAMLLKFGAIKKNPLKGKAPITPKFNQQPKFQQPHQSHNQGQRPVRDQNQNQNLSQNQPQAVSQNIQKQPLVDDEPQEIHSQDIHSQDIHSQNIPQSTALEPQAIEMENKEIKPQSDANEWLKPRILKGQGLNNV